MALSGTFKSSEDNGANLYLDSSNPRWPSYIYVTWSATQNIENNTSTITWKCYGGSNYSNTTAYVACGPVVVTINGTTVLNKTGRVYIYKNTLIGSGSLTVNHNADGTKSVSVGISGAIYNYASNCTYSGTITLDTIPRASSFTVSKTSADMGTDVTFTITRASSAFTHKLTLTWGGVTSNIGTGIATSKVWTIPLSLANDLPSSTSSGCYITCITYNGSTEIGRKTLSMTLKVPSSVKPSISSVTISEAVSGLASKFGMYIQNQSKLQVVTAASGSYSSTIKSYSTAILGKTYSGSTIISGVLTSSGSVSVVVTVTDTRGRTATSTQTVTVTAYSDPTITKFIAQRCNSDGTLNDDGECVKITFAFSVTSLSSKNTKSYTIGYKLKESASYTTLTSGSSYSANTMYTSSAIFSGDNAYDFRLTVADYFKSVAQISEISTAFTLMDFHSSGKGMAIGKVSNTENLLEVALETQFNEPVDFKESVDFEKPVVFNNSIEVNNPAVFLNNQYCFSSPGTAGSAGYVLIARLTHKAANADTPITFIFTRRISPSPMIVHVQFQSNSTTVDPGLERITYEGTNYGAFLVKSATSTWDLYVQKYSAYDTITLNGWFSSATIKSRLTVTFPGTLVSSVPGTYYRATPAKLDSLLDHIFPVGTIYWAYNHTSPASLFGGTWARIANAFLWASDSSGAIGGTGGESTHTLTTSEIPSHTHNAYGAYANLTGGSVVMPEIYRQTSGATHSVATSATGGGGAHNNMPPYIQVSAWRRTA